MKTEDMAIYSQSCITIKSLQQLFPFKTINELIDAVRIAGPDKKEIVKVLHGKTAPCTNTCSVR